MNYPALILFGSFLVLLLLNFPIAIALGLSGLISLFIFQLGPLTFFASQFQAAFDSYPLLTIPLFILAGNVLGRAGIARRLVAFAKALFGPIRGGLALTTILTGLVLAGMSGSAAADVAAMGFLIGIMTTQGYRTGFAASVVATSGGLGVIVPPSINLILYGVITGTSIPALFLAGVFPGALVALLLGAYTLLASRTQQQNEEAEPWSLRNLANATMDAFWGLIAPFVILGGIYSGIFTATESAAIAVVYALLVDLLIYRELSIRELPALILESGRTTGVVMLIIGGAAIFSWVIQVEGIADTVSDWVLGVSGGDKIIVMLLLNLTLIIAGALMDAVSAIFVFTPILFPIAVGAGIDPIHFGAVLTVNLAIGHITPPVGIGLYLASSIAKMPFQRVIAASFPFFITELVALALVSAIPPISTWLPSVLA